MKKLQFLVLTGILSITISCGQQKRYVSYKVQEGENMSDIAERLEMDTKDLLRLNPDVGKKPAPNTVIVIPNPEIKNRNSSNTKEDSTYAVVDEKPKNPDNEDVNETDDKETTSYQTTVVTRYETHEVKPGETVYRITKKYNISKEDLVKLNPEFPAIQSNVLSIGQLLKVKAIEETVTIDKEEVLKQYLTHTVQSKETVFSITRFYNISKEDLIRLNPEYPGIEDNNLSIGQLLKIKPIEEVEKSENLSFYRDSIQENASINLALLLPFKAKEYDTISARGIFKNNKLANMVTDFYLGADMAIDSLKGQGIQINTSLFDTGNRGENISEIIANDELENVDVVIGPFYSEQVEKVSKNTNATVVFPHHSNNQKGLTSSKVVKASPEKAAYISYLTAYLKNTYNGEAIFIVGDGNNDSNTIINAIASSLKKHDSISEVHILKPEKGYIKKDRFTGKMKSGKHNWVIIAADDNVIIADALNSMIGLPDNLTVQVFTTEKSNTYNKIDNNKLAQIHFTYVSDTYSDEASSEVKSFYQKFKKKNNTLPSDYAIKGFDVTYDILMRYASGNELTKTFKEGVSLRVENKFDYHKKTFGAATNQGLFIVKYNDDLSLSRLK